ncbi:MAG: ankyrin repeat domain-containing protein [Deltaproteobacteria bacterium]|nr:ankyrin repeat domain-containing protein [Deltaproteobacteria bacterium]
MRYRSLFLFWGFTVYLLTAGCATAPKTPLIEAASKGQPQMAQKLIQEGARIDEADQHGWTPLFYAVYHGQTETARILIDRGARVNIPDPQGWTPLMYATGYGYPEIAGMLIRSGADVNARNLYGETALHQSVRNMDHKMTKLLVESGADVNIQDSSGTTALHRAAQSYHDDESAEQLLNCLLNKNPDTNLKDGSGWTALRYAIYYRNVGVTAAIRRKTGFAEEIGALAWGEALKVPSYYVPEAEMYDIAAADEKPFKTATSDCNLLVIPAKTGLLIATGPLGYAVGMGIDKVIVKDKFVSCMERMGFNCVKNCSDSAGSSFPTRSAEQESGRR